ncbi:MAG: rhomboid family intramembrane serine protease [Elainellaceae cyanobacterium]
MVPLHDNNPTQTTPVVTYGLVGLNVFIFLYEIMLPDSALQRFIETWGVIPALLSASFDGQVTILVWLTLITSQFLHGGIFHVAGNMLYLWVFGNNVEDKLGHVRFLLFYLACGVFASLFQWYFSQGSNISLIGASGAIAGVMGAYILRFPKAKILTFLPLFPLFLFLPTIRVPAYLFLGFWFVLQAFNSVVSLGMQTGEDVGGVAYWAHSGGFVVGALLGPMLGLMNESPRGGDRRF